jgi:hypothetical protein
MSYTKELLAGSQYIHVHAIRSVQHATWSAAGEVLVLLSRQARMRGRQLVNPEVATMAEQRRDMSRMGREGVPPPPFG